MKEIILIKVVHEIVEVHIKIVKANLETIFLIAFPQTIKQIEKSETFHFVKYFDIAFINYIFIYYIFIQQNTYKIHYIQSFLKLQF